MGEVRGHPPMRRPWREGAPPSSYKRPPIPSFILTPPCEGSLSPSRIIPPWSRISEIHVPGGISSGRSCCFRWIPHGLGLARYMFPVAFRLEGVAASAGSLERGGGGCPVAWTCVRVRMRCWVAALGLPHDLEIGKCTTTSTTSSYSLTKLVVFEGKFSMDVCPPIALYLVDRSWRIVLIIGNFSFSMSLIYT